MMRSWHAAAVRASLLGGVVMTNLLLTVGRLLGVFGFVLMIVAAVVRLTGAYWLGGFQVGTLLLGGTAVMVAGCFLLLLVLTSGDRR
jgi:hypothetical protein